MSKATELAEQLEVFVALDGGDIIHIEHAAAHLRALDASHRQLLEALEACAEVMARMYGNGHSGPKLDSARTAIAAAKELT